MLNKGIITFGMVRKNPMDAPISVPITTKITLNRLFPSSSLKLSTLLIFTASSTDICLNLASTIPENHPAARSGCNVVTGATIKAVMAEYTFEPDNNDPRKARPPVSIIKLKILV